MSGVGVARRNRPVALRRNPPDDGPEGCDGLAFVGAERESRDGPALTAFAGRVGIVCPDLYDVRRSRAGEYLATETS